MFQIERDKRRVEACQNLTQRLLNSFKYKYKYLPGESWEEASERISFNSISRSLAGTLSCKLMHLPTPNIIYDWFVSQTLFNNKVNHISKFVYRCISSESLIYSDGSDISEFKFEFIRFSLVS